MKTESKYIYQNFLTGEKKEGVKVKDKTIPYRGITKVELIDKETGKVEEMTEIENSMKSFHAEAFETHHGALFMEPTMDYYDGFGVATGSLSYGQYNRPYYLEVLFDDSTVKETEKHKTENGTIIGY